MSVYIQSLQNASRTSYSSMVGRQGGFNQAQIVYGKRSSADNNYVNSSGIQNMTGMRSNASSLLEVAQNLMNRDTYNRTSVTSSNTDALSIATTRSSTASFSPIQVDIEQIATGQTNRGTGLAATSLAGLSGTQAFEIEVNGTTHQISFETAFTDNNRSVQQKMAAAINRANIGVTASVSQTESNTFLSVSSNGTGDSDANRFEIRDTTGDIVSRIGVGADSVTQDAQDAIYTVNGGAQRTSATNTVSLNSDVSVTLRAATTQSVTVSTSPDRNYAADQVRDMVKSFNDLMGNARSNQNINSRLHNDLMGTLNSFKPMLEFIGVNVAANGTLSINETKLTQAAQETTSAGKTSSRLEDFFTQTGANNFASRLSAISDRAVNNPQHYTVNTNTGSFNVNSGTANRTGFDFATATETDVINLFSGRGNMLALYNQYASMGQLFNLFI